MQNFIQTDLKNAGYFDLTTNLEKLTCVQKVFPEQFMLENLYVLLDHRELIDEAFLNLKICEERGFVLDRSHTLVLYEKANQLYLLDSGSGTNLAIEPLPLDGGTVQSHVGKFRLVTKETEKGSYAAEVLTDNGWIIRCAFNPVEVDFF